MERAHANAIDGGMREVWGNERSFAETETTADLKSQMNNQSQMPSSDPVFLSLDLHNPRP